MSNHFLEGLEYQWSLVRETPFSQKYVVTIYATERLEAMFDIHYTRPNIVNVTVCFIGNKSRFTDGLVHWLFYDLEKVIRRQGDYKVIDYSLVYGDRRIDGNYCISND